MRYEVIVELKKEVLDAEGRAVRDALVKAGAEGLREVGLSRRFLLVVDDSKPRSFVESLARDFLANPVSEVFRITQL